MGEDPPESVQPMKIDLKPDGNPVSVNVRRYSHPIAEVLPKKVDETLKLGLIKPNKRIQWNCLSLIIFKTGPEQYRFTADIRPVNSHTVPYTWPMPFRVRKIRSYWRYVLFFNLLMSWIPAISSSWDSKKYQSFITPDRVFTPIRVLHDQINDTA